VGQLGAPLVRVQAARQDERVDLLGEAAQEDDERPLGPDPAVRAPESVVVVDGQSQAGLSLATG
jgi:hypothetical protein